MNKRFGSRKNKKLMLNSEKIVFSGGLNSFLLFAISTAAFFYKSLELKKSDFFQPSAVNDLQPNESFNEDLYRRGNLPLEAIIFTNKPEMHFVVSEYLDFIEEISLIKLSSIENDLDNFLNGKNATNEAIINSFNHLSSVNVADADSEDVESIFNNNSNFNSDINTGDLLIAKSEPAEADESKKTEKSSSNPNSEWIKNFALDESNEYEKVDEYLSIIPADPETDSRFFPVAGGGGGGYAFVWFDA
jgi:hypothetical protein